MNDSVTDKWHTERDKERSGLGLTAVLSQQLPGGTE